MEVTREMGDMCHENDAEGFMSYTYYDVVRFSRDSYVIEHEWQ